MAALDALLQGGWTTEDYEKLEGVVRSTIAETAQVRSTLPVGPPAANAYQVVVPKIERKTFAASKQLTMDTTIRFVPVRISCMLRVASEQIGDPAVLTALARRAAHSVAGFEDLVLAYGGFLDEREPMKHDSDDAGVTVAPLRGAPSLSVEGFAPDPDPAKPTVVDVVQKAVSALQSKGHFGPYSVLMLSEMWKQASSVTGTKLNAEVMKCVLGEGGQLVPIRSPTEIAKAYGGRGIVISRGTGAFDLVQVSPPTVALVNYDAADLVLRVEERVVLRVLDASAAHDIVV
jgi:hypothetical protein